MSNDGSFVPMQTTNSEQLLTARHRSIDEWFWGHWFERSVRSAFSTSYVQGLDRVLEALPQRTGRPLVMYCTHGSWWDAAIVMMIALRVLRIRSFGMMEYRQLVRYPFFRRIGLFSVVREDARSALESLRYAAGCLNRQPGVLWMFPQGTLRHQDVRPLNLEPGIGILARSVPSLLMCPVAIRYDMVKEQRPEFRLHFGEIHEPGSQDIRAITEDCEVRLLGLADTVREAALSDDCAHWRVLHHGPRSMEKRFDAIKRVFLHRP